MFRIETVTHMSEVKLVLYDGAQGHGSIGKIICSINPADKTQAHVDSVHVKEFARGRFLGKLLLQQALTELYDLNVRHVGLEAKEEAQR